MPLHIAFAVGVALLAAEAATTLERLEATQKALEQQVNNWRSSSGNEDRIIIEDRGSGSGIWLSEATTITVWNGKYHGVKTDFTHLHRYTGRITSAAVAELITRSERYDGYRFRCKCLDANSLRVTIVHEGRATTLVAYGVDNEAKDAAAAVMRDWESLEEELSSGGETAARYHKRAF